MTLVALEIAPPRSISDRGIRIATVVLVTAVAWWAATPYLVGVFHDDGVYLLLARAVNAGQGWRYVQLTGSPVATHHPPLYPALLALAWAAAPSFPANVLLFLALNALLLAAFAASLHELLVSRLGWSASGAALVVLAACLGAPVLALSGALLSEPLFLALVGVALRHTEEVVAAVRRPRAVIGTGALLGLVLLTRMHGVALLAAGLLLLVARRRLRDAALLAGGALLVMLPWLLVVARAAPIDGPLAGAYGSYGGWFAAGIRDGGVALLGSTVRLNAREIVLLIGDQLAFPRTALLLPVVAAAVVALTVIGARRLARRAPVTALFTLLFLVVVLVWPFAPWRFVWTLWPFLILLAAEGVRALLPRGIRAVPAVALVALLPLSAYLAAQIDAYRTRAWERPAREATRTIAPLVQWVREHTFPTDVVLAEGEPIVSLLTGRRAAPPASFTAREYVSPPTVGESAERLGEMLRSVPARYVVLVSPTLRAAARERSALHPGLTPVASFGTGEAFRVVP